MHKNKTTDGTSFCVDPSYAWSLPLAGLGLNIIGKVILNATPDFVSGYCSARNEK